LEDAAWWYKLIGNGYWFLVTDAPGVGPIREIWPLPADRVAPDPTTLRISPITYQPVIDYQYSMGSLIKLPGENVIHFRTANPFDPWRGLSPLSALRDNMRTSNAIMRWLGSFYDKGNAVPASVISLPPLINDEDFETIKQDIYEQFGGKRQTAVTRAGDLKVEVIGQSSTDMQVVEHQKFNKQEVREVYRIPEGLTAATSGQSRLAAETALARDAIQPLLDYFAETFTLFAMRFYEEGKRNTLRVKAKSVIPQDRALEISEYKSYGADRTINEGRQKQGLPPLKLTGKLAEFQQLLDEVPATLIQTLAPILTGGGKTAGGLGGALPPQLAGGQPLQVRGSQPNAQLPDLQQTGQNGEDSDPGYRVSGLPTAIDPIQEMLGTGKSALAALSNPERDAMLYALFNQGAKRADLTREQPELINAFLNLLETQTPVNR
jgi:HK97 family phage portal protein